MAASFANEFGIAEVKILFSWLDIIMATDTPSQVLLIFANISEGSPLFPIIQHQAIEKFLDF